MYIVYLYNVCKHFVWTSFQRSNQRTLFDFMTPKGKNEKKRSRKADTKTSEPCSEDEVIVNSDADDFKSPRLNFRKPAAIEEADESLLDISTFDLGMDSFKTSESETSALAETTPADRSTADEEEEISPTRDGKTTDVSADAREDVVNDTGWCCQRCTFLNHELLTACEMCSSPSGRRAKRRRAARTGGGRKRSRSDATDTQRARRGGTRSARTTAPRTVSPVAGTSSRAAEGTESLEMTGATSDTCVILDTDSNGSDSDDARTGRSPKGGRGDSDDLGRSPKGGRGDSDDLGRSPKGGRGDSDDLGRSPKGGSGDSDDLGRSAKGGRGDSDDLGRSPKGRRGDSDDLGRSPKVGRGDSLVVTPPRSREDDDLFASDVIPDSDFSDGESADRAAVRRDDMPGLAVDECTAVLQNSDCEKTSDAGDSEVCSGIDEHNVDHTRSNDDDTACQSLSAYGNNAGQFTTLRQPPTSENVDITSGPETSQVDAPCKVDDDCHQLTGEDGSRQSSSEDISHQSSSTAAGAQGKNFYSNTSSVPNPIYIYI